MGDILTLNKLPAEIREACRGDRQISRATLIGIARHKQERAMLTAFDAYREKLSKEKTVRGKIDPNDPTATITLLAKTAAKLASLDTAAWGEEDLATFASTAADLWAKLDARFPVAGQAGGLA